MSSPLPQQGLDGLYYPKNKAPKQIIIDAVSPYSWQIRKINQRINAQNTINENSEYGFEYDPEEEIIHDYGNENDAINPFDHSDFFE